MIIQTMSLAISEDCCAYAERNNYDVIGVYKDEHITGTSDNRPDFLRMIEDSKKKLLISDLVNTSLHQLLISDPFFYLHS